MIEGTVNPDLEATVSVDVRGPGGQSFLVEAVVDTGFSDYLTLPSAQVGELGLRHRTRSTTRLGDGSKAAFDVYDAELVWDGRLVTALVDEAETTPLVGMALLEGHELRIETRTGGRVLIEPLTR